MSDDWKGEAIIKRKPTRAEQIARGQSAVQSHVHNHRTAEGSNMSKAGGTWARRIKAACIEAGAAWRDKVEE